MLIPMKIIFFLLLFFSFSLSAQQWSIATYGCDPTGHISCTQKIQKAIDECGASTGGTVVVPPGIFQTGALFMRSNVELFLSHNARLIASCDNFNKEEYPEDARAIINFLNVSNAALTGTGTIDGRGSNYAFAQRDSDGNRKATRRFNDVNITNSHDILVKDVTLTSPSTWTLKLQRAEEVRIQGIRIYSFATHNNDGIDVIGKNVTISDCIIYCEDDAICLKSPETEKEYITENIAISNCILATCCNAIKCGTEGFGGFRNITVSNCVINRPPTYNVKDRTEYFGIEKPNTGEMGIALLLTDGGIMENITITNISMQGVMTPIFIRFDSRNNIPRYMKNILISNVEASSDGYMTSSITGIPGYKVSGITLSDIIFTGMGKGTEAFASLPVKEPTGTYPTNKMFGFTLPSHGLYIRHAENITLENIQLFTKEKDARPGIQLDDVNGLYLNNFQGDMPSGNQPFLRLANCKDLIISGLRQQGLSTARLIQKDRNCHNIRIIRNVNCKN
jgi:polygalacturonase